MKKSHPIKIIIPILLLILITLLGTIFAKSAMARTLQKKYTEQMTLGARYLQSQNYEEAIIAFNRAIEIDPRHAESYLSLSEAYAAAGDYENAVASLVKGYEFTQDSELETVRKKYQVIVDGRPVLERLTSLMAQSERENIWQFQQEEEYMEFISKLEEPVNYPAVDGKYLLIYPCGHCYYGTMKDGVRSGNGIWSAYSFIENNIDLYDGKWKDDYPSGYGRYWQICVEVPEDLFFFDGTWNDGFEDGTINYQYISRQGGETYQEETTYISNDGMRAEVQDLHPERKQDWSGREYYCYSSDSERSYYTPVNVRHGIAHARKGQDEGKTGIKHELKEVLNAKEKIEAELAAKRAAERGEMERWLAEEQMGMDFQ